MVFGILNSEFFRRIRSQKKQNKKTKKQHQKKQQKTKINKMSIKTFVLTFTPMLIG